MDGMDLHVFYFFRYVYEVIVRFFTHLNWLERLDLTIIGNSRKKFILIKTKLQFCVEIIVLKLQKLEVITKIHIDGSPSTTTT